VAGRISDAKVQLPLQRDGQVRDPPVRQAVSLSDGSGEGEVILTRLQLIAIAALAAILLVMVIVQTVRIDGLRIGPIGWYGYKEKYGIAVEKLRSIATTKNEQREATKGNIDQAEKDEREVKVIVERIRAAPIPENCQTPGIDILRNEI
jgi:hypothetical protein